MLAYVGILKDTLVMRWAVSIEKPVFLLEPLATLRHVPCQFRAFPPTLIPTWHPSWRSTSIFKAYLLPIPSFRFLTFPRWKQPAQGIRASHCDLATTPSTPHKAKLWLRWTHHTLHSLDQTYCNSVTHSPSSFPIHASYTSWFTRPTRSHPVFCIHVLTH